MTKKSKKTMKPINLKKQIMMIGFVIVALVFLPTTVLLVVGMLPSLVALMFDRFKFRALAITFANFGGAWPFLLELWSTGHSFDNTFNLIVDPRTIIVMYCAAGAGYIIDWAVVGFANAILIQQGKSRMKAIKKQQAKIEERWGQDVTGDYPLDERGFIIRQASVDPQARDC